MIVAVDRPNSDPLYESFIDAVHHGRTVEGAAYHSDPGALERQLRGQRRRTMQRKAAGMLPARNPRSGRWPGLQRRADLPLVAEGVDDPAEPPPMLVTHGGRFRRASGHRLAVNQVGIFNDE